MNVHEWKEAGNYFDYKGNNIFYRSLENGKPYLLCLHGFPTSSYDYHKIWDALSERFSPVSFDMIGYGYSDKPRNFNYTTSAQVNVLQSLLEHLKIKKTHILSHDYGNTIVQELLARDEEKQLEFEMQTLCFMNGALFPETHKPILAQKILISPIGFLFGKLIPASKYRQALASVFGENTQPTKEEFDDFMYLFQHNGGRNISHILIQYMRERSVYRERWVGGMKRMKQPFRLINGLEDRVSGQHLVNRFREVLPEQKDIVELEGIGHFPHFEVPDILLKHFFDFHK